MKAKLIEPSSVVQSIELKPLKWFWKNKTFKVISFLYTKYYFLFDLIFKYIFRLWISLHCFVFFVLFWFVSFFSYKYYFMFHRYVIIETFFSWEFFFAFSWSIREWNFGQWVNNVTQFIGAFVLALSHVMVNLFFLSSNSKITVVIFEWSKFAMNEIDKWMGKWIKGNYFL